MRWQNRKPKVPGFSLVEALISLAIISIVSLAFAGLFGQMNREMRATNEKNDANEFFAKTATILSHLPVCDCQLSANSTPFDSTAAQPISNISKVLSSCEPTAELLMASNTLIPSSRTTLSVDQIQITNIESLGSPDLYRGILKVTYKSDTLVRALKGFEYELRFETNPLSPATQKQLTRCVAISGITASPTPTNISGSCPSGEYLSGISNGVIQCTPLPPPTLTSFTCPANEYLTGVVNGTPQCSALKMKSCPPGQFMVGHNSGNLDCTRAPNPTPTPTSPWSLGNPGPGCSSNNCISEDFGPCTGNNCLTNGLSCKGASCSACAVGAVCTGALCCTGPLCPGCSP